MNTAHFLRSGGLSTALFYFIAMKLPDLPTKWKKKKGAKIAREHVNKIEEEHLFSSSTPFHCAKTLYCIYSNKLFLLEKQSRTYFGMANFKKNFKKPQHPNTLKSHLGYCKDICLSNLNSKQLFQF